MAQDLAHASCVYSTTEILERSLAITAAAAKRLKIKKVSAWQVAMAEEKEFVTPEMRQPLAGKGTYGRKGFDGRYSHHVAEVYRDPAKREYYQRRAAEINAEPGVRTLNSLAGTQKRASRQLIQHMIELADNEMHIVLMVVPSQAKPSLFTSSGFAASYYKLLSRDGRGHEQFMAICKGGALLQEAAGLPSASTTGRLKRNDKRAEVILMLKNLISKHPLHDLIPLN